MKDNLFTFMNDLEVFKHTLEQVCDDHSLEALTQNPYYQLMSCILDCIYTKVVQIK